MGTADNHGLLPCISYTCPEQSKSSVPGDARRQGS